MVLFLLFLSTLIIISYAAFKKNKTRANKKNFCPSCPATVQNKDFSIFKKIQIPPDTLKLLWFADGTFKNYDKAPEEKMIIEELGISFKITTNIGSSSGEEPSLISVKYPIEENTLCGPLCYFPSYEGMTPAQRFCYIKWLSDITQPIDIGFVFVFYYGLERHLLYGEYEHAFNTVLKLRKYHTGNYSFNGYSSNALLGACIIHNRKDLFEQIKHLYNINDDFFIFACRHFEIPLSFEDIFYLHNKLQISNKRYIKQYPERFKTVLKKILTENYNLPFFDLKTIDIEKCPEKQTCLFANISLGNNTRWRTIPILINEKTRETFVKFFKIAHNEIKQELQKERKRLK